MHNFLKALPFFLLIFSGCRRSVHRPPVKNFPEIVTNWQDAPEEKYHLKNSHLEPVLFTVYDKEYLESQQLPATLSSRYDSSVIYKTQDFMQDLEEVVKQLQTTKKKIKKLDNFTILKQRDYNYLKHTGLMILRHKKYPFVIKLFMETPSNFVKPFNRGVEECAFFIMGGGMSRYLAGFTRIHNCYEIREKIRRDDHWSSRIEAPRKWYWQPHDTRLIEITGTHIGSGSSSMALPSIYAIICDAVESECELSILKPDDRKEALEILQFLGIRIDPHINNFMVDKHTKKIVIIDTEHFPILVGIKDSFDINDYVSYYCQLVLKFLRNKLCMDKKTRIELQTKPQPPLFVNK